MPKTSNHRVLSPDTKATDLAWLLGQPQLGDYLHFVDTKIVGGSKIDPRALVAEWQTANDYYGVLEQQERGIADTITCLPIKASVKDRVAAVMASPWFTQSFDNLPTTIERVELDKLIVTQLHVERSHAWQQAQALTAKPKPRPLFDICLPLQRDLPAVSVQRLAGNKFRFSSYSTDFRAHEPQLLGAAALGSMMVNGPVHSSLCLPVGFGSNFLSGVRSGKRVALQNGYHRAFALRSIGVTHAYCIIEEVTRKDELRLTADDELAADPEFFFAAARPPLLRDFFDPRIVKWMQVMPVLNEIEVEITVRSGHVMPTAPLS